ncbi:MAG: prephenate dehydratase, partial [Candidatus Methylomirabilis sp.]|nr:prephenate dehydratase [Deltaproteobacteria bacterium]
ILERLNERARAAEEIGKIKRGRGAEFHVPEREREVMEKLSRANEGPLPDTAVRAVFREVMSACLALERPLRVAVLGPQGTFSHAAAERAFGSSAAILYEKSFRDIFDAVERGAADYGVAPIENSTEGVVSQTLDLFADSPLRIVGEAVLPISFCLLSASSSLGDVKRVYSHWQPLAQCREWLRANLPEAELEEVESTTAAAGLAQGEKGAGAVAAKVAAELYNLNVLAERIEDNLNNRTRFVILGKREPAPSGRDRTSLMFSVKDEVGVLYAILGVFAAAGINLSKIESRPMKRRAWEYIFYVDLEGHAREEKVAAAVEAVRERCRFLKVLGSYPRAAAEADGR